MYIPNHYKADNKEDTLAFMQRFNFATIVTSVNEVPIATHLPFVISESNNEIILTSHFAAGNPQWKDIEDKENLVIFSEPHAYISPDHYDKKENVPTWNYISVHAYGKATILSEEEDVFMVLEIMMDSFDANYKAQWKELSMEYKSSMAKGIVAFTIQVSKLDSKEKLSQNKSQNERNSIISSLSESEDMNESTLADYMRSKGS